MSPMARRASYVFLCSLPFVDLVVVGMRALRIPGVHQLIGALLFASVAIAAWILGGAATGSAGGDGRRLAVAGLLLIAPFAVVSLLWVGLGAPFEATAAENHMRYLVLLADALVVAGAFVVVKEELDGAGERFYSTLGFAASIPAGAAYFLCISMSLAGSVLVLRNVPKSPANNFLNELYGILEFVACLMTYATTAAFAAALGRVQWLGRGATRAYVTASLVLSLLVVVGGVDYPEISGRTPPWYTTPGVIARIPAIPWIMPCLFGVVLLRRAGETRPGEPEVLPGS